MYPELEFKNPEFYAGVNYTVRMGSKWKRLVKIGDVVNLPKHSSQQFSPKAYITDVIYCNIRNIPPVVLRLEHDPKCRDLNGLVEVLCDTYGIERPDPLHRHHSPVHRRFVTCLGFVQC